MDSFFCSKLTGKLWLSVGFDDLIIAYLRVNVGLIYLKMGGMR